MWQKWISSRLQYVNRITTGDADGSGEGTDDSASGDGTGTGNAGGTGNAPVTFDARQQAEVDRIVADRLARDRKTAKVEADKAAERAKLEGEERLKAEKLDAEAKATAAEERAKRAEWRADLADFVVDTNAAVKLLDPEAHLKTDGTVDTDKFLKAYPYLKKAAKADSTGPGTGGADGKGKTGDSWGAAEAADRKRRGG